MSRGMQQKMGDEPIRPGGNHGLYTRQEKQSRPDDLAKSFLNILSINLIPMSNQKTIFVILRAAKNLSFKAAEICNEAALRSE
jgi:hypothetical protein